MERPHQPSAVPFEHYPELNYLRSEELAVSASISDTSARYPEFARTISSLYAQGYIHGGDHEGESSSWARLTRAQPAETRLTVRTFRELNRLSREATPDPDSYLALEVYDVIHDAFKDLVLMPLVGLGRDDNHDNALERLFLPEYAHVRREHFPSLESLNERQFNLIRGAAKVNFIRFAQSQASEYEVEMLATLPKDQRRFAIMHGIHDLAGAMSDEDPTTSRSLDEPAATRLLDAAHALLTDPNEYGLPDTAHSHRLMYMQLRGTRLGLITPEMTGEEVTELPVKLTVADLLRCYSAEDFAVPHAAFNRLPVALRTMWAQIKALPIQTDTRFEGSGTEYASAFLRAFGEGEDAIYTALGCYAQIQSHATALPFEIIHREGGAGPYDRPDQPYSKINLYHLAKSFGGTTPTFAKPVWLEYTVSDDILIPKLAAPGRERTRAYNGYVMRLSHPNVFQV